MQSLLLTALLLISTTIQSKPPVLLIGGVSKHLNTNTTYDEINPLIGLEFNGSRTCQIGVYDNSRIKESYSYYASCTILSKPLTNSITLTSKAGVVYYDNMTGHSAYLSPLASIGIRIDVTDKLFINIDAIPVSLMKKNSPDILTAIIGVRF